MEYRALGSSGLKVSCIALGSWLTYGGTVDEDEAVRIVARAFELGVNLFDTADVYSGGQAEVVLGRAVRHLPRERIAIATKARGRTWDGPMGVGLSRKHLVESVDRSLARLGVEYIDLYQLHAPDPDTPLEETLATLDDLVRRGKILYTGLSNFDTEQTRDVLETCERCGFEQPVSAQPPYSMLDREIETTLLARCLEEGIGCIVYSPLAQGVLTGKYKSAAAKAKGTRAGSHPDWIKRHLTAENLGGAGKLSKLAAKKKKTPAQIALAWVLRRPEITSAIVGASSMKQLEENVRAAGVRLSKGDLRELDDMAVPAGSPVKNRP